jgi:hypothetical protein
MKRLLLSSALVAALFAASAFAAETLPAGRLAAERYQLVTAPDKLPATVRLALAREFGQDQLNMAAAGAPFNSTDVIMDASLPGRRLVAAAVGDTFVVVHFEQGGVVHSRHVVVFERTPRDATRIWSGSVNHTYTDPAELERAIRSGALWGPARRP